MELSWCAYSKCKTQIIFVDKALFYLCTYVNSKNNMYLSVENSMLIQEVQLHYNKVGKWCDKVQIR